MTSDRFVSRRELAELLGRTPGTVLIWQREGLIAPREYVGPKRLAMYSLTDAQAVLKHKRKGAATAATAATNARRQRRVDARPAATTRPTPAPAPPPTGPEISAYEQAAQQCRDYLEAGATPEYVASALDLSVDQVRAIGASRRRRREDDLT